MAWTWRSFIDLLWEEPRQSWREVDQRRKKTGLATLQIRN